jgi:6-phosphofructokinase
MPRPISGNLVVCQSGGPTAVINSSLAGVVDEALQHVEIRGIYGAVNGVLGILNRSMIDLRREGPSVIAGLRKTPSAGLSSCRYKLREEDLEKVLDVFKAYHIRYFVMNGGNDSMDTGYRIHHFARKKGYDLQVIGIPKTIDNDLLHTDHCPGYGSVSRWLAIATMDAGKDTEAISTADPIKIIETMGRDAGWVSAATALAHQEEGDAPHLIYIPEVPFLVDTFLDDVQRVYDTLGYAVIVVGEGLRGQDGRPLAESKWIIDTDSFGHRQPGGVGQCLADLVAKHLRLKARCDKPGTIQRSSILLASKTDLDEAYWMGQMAVLRAIEGNSGYMVTLERKDQASYSIETGLVELQKVANQVRVVPSDFFDQKNRFVTPAFIRYITPLIGDPLPRYTRLRRFAVADPGDPVK